MSLRQYITIMLIATVLCWTSWVFVIINIDPFEARALSFSFFYISLFFALVGTFSVIIFGVYSFFLHKNEPMFRSVQKSFRDSLIVSLFLTILLFLQGKNLLNIWNTIVLFAALISLSIFFIFNKKSARV